MTLAEEVFTKIEALEARMVISDEALRHLSALWNIIQAEVCYDPYNAATQQFAMYLKPHIDALNAEIKFRR